MMIGKKVTQRVGAVLAAALVFAAASARAGTLERRPNLADLVAQAEIILHGDVVEVTDGIENNVPFTEVKVKVREALRGTTGPVYTFRQFGLLAPRRMGNGLINYAVRPAGWATYRKNEEVVLFLYKAARKTGLRTTVGLGQGKFTVRAGRAVSQEENVGLFENLQVDRTVLGERDAKMLATRRGPVSSEGFLSLVRRAVGERWIETRRMSDAR
jgi:hypothetical protein